MYWGGSVFYFDITTTDRQHSKMLILSTNLDSKLLEIEFLIAILSPDWQKRAIKTTVSNNFLSSFVDC